MSFDLNYLQEIKGGGGGGRWKKSFETLHYRRSSRPLFSYLQLILKPGEKKYLKQSERYLFSKSKGKPSARYPRSGSGVGQEPGAAAGLERGLGREQGEPAGANPPHM